MGEGRLAEALVQCIRIFLSLNFIIQTGKCEEFKTFALQMPNVRPTTEDSYFCTSIRIDENTEFYVTAFTPNASMEIAHHIRLTGCEVPGSYDKVWNCSPFGLQEPGLNHGLDCIKSHQIIYGWARDAPKLELPEGVAFRIGGKTSIKYIVLQVHYSSVERFKEEGVTDNSGIIITYTKTPMPKSAGLIMLVSAGGYILPNMTEYFEISCKINVEAELHPIAFRVHTHESGKVVSGFKVIPSPDILQEQWTLIGKENPLNPQAFYPVQNDDTIQKGDVVAARCTIRNEGNYLLKLGFRSKDEMCNYYVLFWVWGDPVQFNYCSSAGPPKDYWFHHDLKRIPNEIASSLPAGESGEKQIYFEKTPFIFP